MARYETFEGTIIRTTDRAILVECPDGEEVWIPRSCCEGGDDLDEGDADPQVAEWFIEREGLS